MIIAQLTLYRRNDHLLGTRVYVVVLESHPKMQCFSLTAYRGKLETLVCKGFAVLRRAKFQKHIGRFSAMTAFDELTHRIMHNEHYTGQMHGIYQPTEEPPLAVDIARAMRIQRSKARPRPSLSDDLPPIRKRRLLEFSNA